MAEDCGSTGSRCSGDSGSVTDSGQGASEEGDYVASPDGARVRDKSSRKISNKGKILKSLSFSLHLFSKNIRQVQKGNNHVLFLIFSNYPLTVQ